MIQQLIILVPNISQMASGSFQMCCKNLYDFSGNAIDSRPMLVILQGPRGRGGAPQRGGRGGVGTVGVRGNRGGNNRGGRGMASGRGGTLRGGAGSRGGQQRGGKRKMGGDHNQGQTKKRNTDGNWGAQPIAQQPLNDSQWYQDSYGQQWG